jgi:hypothetical protein
MATLIERIKQSHLYGSGRMYISDTDTIVRRTNRSVSFIGQTGDAYTISRKDAAHYLRVRKANRTILDA